MLHGGPRRGPSSVALTDQRFKFQSPKKSMYNLHEYVELTTVNGRPFSLIDDSGFRKSVDPILKALPAGERLFLNSENVLSSVLYAADDIWNQIETELKILILKREFSI
ncbi:uncharacterized protein LOC117182598 [Belonocnema kinseyi]|uniref:uncharacterized protein LOC117182598 n=1 Tax=Belonocnema kinseyi TaxID=2817044 RepID=UPI00143DC6D0|nr:uncharacterized protein LOC117182598 [Belonocnema kinseyi]